MSTLAQWIERQRGLAASKMQVSISPTGIVHQRPGFGLTIRPQPGAIVASPVLAAYDPEPDYFFHWYRDSAVVMDALRLLHEQGLADSAVARFTEFVHFSLSLLQLDGRRLVKQPQWRGALAPTYVQYVRDDAELNALHGELISADTRVNADGSLDISKWARPQHDGPPLRALTLLQWLRTSWLDTATRDATARLLRTDLQFTRDRAAMPCFDIWEEELGLHYYTLCVSAAALEQGGTWLRGAGEMDEATACEAQASTLRRRMQDYWLPEQGYIRSRVLSSGERSRKELDIAVVLAAVHSALPGSDQALRDPHLLRTLDQLDGLFDRLYPINHGRPANRAAALGRYEGDVYYAGGAYFFSTLGAAEFCFRLAKSAPDAAALLARGDAYLETVRAYVPDSGDMAEQFDQRSGAPASARHLAWSYAAFISCVHARSLVGA